MFHLYSPVVLAAADVYDREHSNQIPGNEKWMPRDSGGYYDKDAKLKK